MSIPIFWVHFLGVLVINTMIFFGLRYGHLILETPIANLMSTVHMALLFTILTAAHMVGSNRA